MRNLGLTIWIVVGAACAIVLFQIKEEVNVLEEQLAQVQRQIKTDQEAIRILQAEWSYLNRPERLARLSTQYLSLKPLDPAQIISLKDIPLKGEEETPGTSIKLPGSATPASAEVSQ